MTETAIVRDLTNRTTKHINIPDNVPNNRTAVIKHITDDIKSDEKEIDWPEFIKRRKD